MIPCQLYTLVGWFLQLYVLAMLLYALVSWVPSLKGRWSDYIAMLIEPVLIPIRRIIPPLGMFDLSFLVLIIVIQSVLAYSVTPYSCRIF